MYFASYLEGTNLNIRRLFHGFSLCAITLITSAPVQSQTVRNSNSDEVGDYSYVIQGCTLKAVISYKKFDPDRRSDRCNRSDLQTASYTIDLKKIELAALNYSKTSFSGPELSVRCAADNCGVSEFIYANGCTDRFVSRTEQRSSVSYSSSAAANSLFLPMWRDLKRSLTACAPHVNLETNLELPLQEIGTPETRKCSDLYIGRAIKFRPAGAAYLGVKFDAVVVGTNRDKASIRLAKNQGSLSERVFELSCGSNQLFID